MSFLVGIGVWLAVLALATLYGVFWYLIFVEGV